MKKLHESLQNNYYKYQQQNYAEKTVFGEMNRLGLKRRHSDSSYVSIISSYNSGDNGLRKANSYLDIQQLKELVYNQYDELK